MTVSPTATAVRGRGDSGLTVGAVTMNSTMTEPAAMLTTVIRPPSIPLMLSAAETSAFQHMRRHL